MAKRFRGNEVRAGGKPPTWREKVAALKYVPPLVKMVWETHRGYTVTMAMLRLVQAFVPIAMLWVGKLIIDTLIAARAGNDTLRHLLILIGVEIAIAVARDILGRASSLVESLLGDLFSNHTSIRLMQHAATLDLYHFEDPAFYDRLERARQQTTSRIRLLAMIFSMAQNSLTLLSLGAALAAYSPWLLVLLGVTLIPSFLGETHFASLEYSLLFSWTPQRRQLDYIRFLGASDKTAKEIQMFGLAPWLVARYKTLADRYYEENKRLSIRKGIAATGLAMIGKLGYYGGYVFALVRAVDGSITIGSFTFLVASFAQGQGLIGGLLQGASDIYEQNLYLKDLFEFFEMRPSIASVAGAPKVPIPIREGFVFEDVGFVYPGSERWAIRHVNFTLRPGERIAFVGENGAGKTTLTKLIARLYDPSEGRILLDGRDVKEYDLTSLRATVSVIFQDFVRYDLSFEENIGVGEIESVSEYLDRDLTTETAATIPEPITSAAEKSLASSLLPRFAAGYGQMLGRRFTGGVDLSGGEWQKVALARAYMRESQVLILDEPTAALDARAEYEVFTRFSELVSGRMAIIISHRFSTVRMADRIVVLRDGTVTEEGTHAELVAHRGLYAELFELQAEGYR
ncbi:MAG: transport protein [Chlorobi bacterium]|nr:transport protein [Chlorobiota bacterium]